MIVLTAPTGTIGRQVLAALLESGQPLRVIVRDPARLPTDIRERVEVVQGSHGDGDIVTEAFAGAQAVFWLVPPHHQADDIHAAYVDFTRPACEAFGTAGVARVVGISALGRGTPQAQHAGLVTASLAMDDLIAESGVAYRALTMPSFMDNIAWQTAAIRDHGAFFSPIAADRALPTCATSDIAATAAGLLLDDSWSGVGAVPVLGPEDLSMHDMARIASDVLGRAIRFERITFDAFKTQLIDQGDSAAFAQAMTDMMAAKNDGMDNVEPRTAESTTPTTFAAWCQKVLKPAVLG